MINIYPGNIKTRYLLFQVTQLHYLPFDDYHLCICLREFDIQE
jgi:hypothetical protein